MKENKKEVKGMNMITTIIFAIAAGVAVGNLYLSQPLFEIISKYFQVSSEKAAMLVTVTQLGYAIGIFLLVPLGDVLNRKKLIPTILSISAISLIIASFAPNFYILLGALGGLGLTTVSAQLLTPLASELAEPEKRGKVVSTVASGALIGILVSRTVSGIIADLFGWRSIYLFSATLVIILSILLSRVIPTLEKKENISYIKLLKSVFQTAAKYKQVPPTLIITAANFMIFSLFWTALTYLLSAEPFNYSTSQIGLLGLAGLAGAVGARNAGMFHDRGYSSPATGGALILLAISLVLSWFFKGNIFGLIMVVIILDIAIQINLVLGQTRLLSLSENSRSRLNTIIVVCNFIGGSIGSALAGKLWGIGGWFAIVAVGLIICSFAFIVWLVSKKNLNHID